jgi:hypothetical protein
MATEEVQAYIKRSRIAAEDFEQITDCSKALKRILILKLSRDNGEKDIIIKLSEDIRTISARVGNREPVTLTEEEKDSIRRASMLKEPNTDGIRQLAITLMIMLGIK